MSVPEGPPAARVLVRKTSIFEGALKGKMQVPEKEVPKSASDSCLDARKQPTEEVLNQARRASSFDQAAWRRKSWLYKSEGEEATQEDEAAVKKYVASQRLRIKQIKQGYKVEKLKSLWKNSCHTNISYSVGEAAIELAQGRREGRHLNKSVRAHKMDASAEQQARLDQLYYKTYDNLRNRKARAEEKRALGQPSASPSPGRQVERPFHKPEAGQKGETNKGNVVFRRKSLLEAMTVGSGRVVQKQEKTDLENLELQVQEVAQSVDQRLRRPREARTQISPDAEPPKAVVDKALRSHNLSLAPWQKARVPKAPRAGSIRAPPLSARGSCRPE